ncbi:37S ribosomal protein S22 [Entomophthora muscae]|uniref:37S ribosomal protein S22 n=1 Tax=Entomophthora muscae TaxID=34485 RepID=A0ACC2RS57_9FUNG|nr:37S ribosomal protein S22 [Entomophthora muscae]
MSNYLKHLTLARVAAPLIKPKFSFHLAGSKTLAQKLINNEVKLVGIAPPKGDPSWDWHEEKTLEDPENSLQEQSIFKFELVDGTEEIAAAPKQRGSSEIKFSKFGDKMVEIPVVLKELIQQKLKGQTLEKVREDALRIFASNRSLNETKAVVQPEEPEKRYGHKRPPLNASVPHALSYGPPETIAYLAGLMPSTYATLYRVFSEIRVRDSRFKPTRVLDFGTGPGTSLWALGEVWDSDQLKYFRGVDLSESMLEVANEFAKSFGQGKERFDCKIRFDRHFSFIPGEANYDLVIASHVFSEYPSDALRIKALETLWEQCGNTLVLIERGTPKGYHIMNQARELLKSCESHIMGPCAQDKGCPLANTSKFCHFQQQLQRPRFMMDVKGSKSNQEFANYSYIILRKGPRPTLPQKITDTLSYEQSSYHWGRIVDKPSKRGKHIKLNTCSPDGVLFEDSAITKAQGDQIFRDARKASWGDLFPHKAKTSPKLHFPSSFIRRSK